MSLLVVTGCSPSTADTSDEADADVGGPPTPVIVYVESQYDHSCAVSEFGELRCWGRGQWGLLAAGEHPECGVAFGDGLPSTCAIGDDEAPAAGPLIDLGGPVRQVALSRDHVCGLLDDGSVRCWGRDFAGAVLGLAGLSDGVVGDDESPASLPTVDLGAPAVQLVAGSVHNCALTEAGGVRCWGIGDLGLLGYGLSLAVGDDETPASFGDVPIGGPVRSLAAWDFRTCAVLISGKLRCWGNASAGLLGYGTLAHVMVTPEEAGDVPLELDIVDVALSSQASCVLDSAGSVWCWGQAQYTGSGNNSFDVLTSEQAVEVQIGAEVVALVGGYDGFCVLTVGGGVRCWGGLNGYPGGAFELPGAREEVADLGDLELDAVATSVAVGAWDGGCITTSAGAVRCWGRAPFHGYPGIEDLGDDEAPGAAGDLELF